MLERLLVPLDGSETAELALPSAMAMADCFGCEIMLLCVAHIPHVIGGHGDDLTEPCAVLLENRRRAARQYIQETAVQLQAKGYHVRRLVWEGESEAEVILHAADELTADLIIMSSHGHGGVYRWAFGSTADKVLRAASIPLLLIPVS